MGDGRYMMMAWLLGLLAAAARAQQPMPFPGSGTTPPSVPAVVHVSAYLDRMLNVDDRAYTFQAVMWIYLSWRDPRTVPQILSNLRAQQASNGTYECQFVCQSNNEAGSGGCCDGVWTPYIAFTNLQFLPEDRVVRYGMGGDPTSDTVFYWSTIQGTWYTGMNLRAFPFDSQQLLVQLEVPQARAGWAGSLLVLKPSVTGVAMFTARTSGDQLSGWGVTGLAMEEFSYELCSMPLRYASGLSASTDPSPLVPEYLADYRGDDVDNSGCAQAIMEQPNPYSSVYWRPGNWPPARADLNESVPSSIVQPGPIVVSGLNIIIGVRRFYSPYIMTAIFPIVATTWLAFMVFFLPRQDMEARLGAVTGLFLAMAAIQFVVQDRMPASSYVTAMQQLVLTSYVCLILVGIMNLFIWHFTVYHKNKEM